MASNQDIKKVYRKEDESLEKRKCRRGKQSHQKMKPYLVYQYLMRNSDIDHTHSASDIIGFLEDCGINADRRSIYKDIEEINIIYWMLENDSDIYEAEEVILEENDDADKVIIYDKNKKGFYANPLKYEVDDIKLLAECINSAKFISDNDSDRLTNVICDLVSEHQSTSIRGNSLTIGRIKTTNRKVFYNIGSINYALSEENDHIPCKISFSYLTRDLSDINKMVDRQKKYVVSPYQLLINDGNYYLLAFDDKSQEMRTYRVDRMKDVQELEGVAREGKDAFKSIDMKTYTQRVFSMYSGEKKEVRLRFVKSLLDTVTDRFGTLDAHYSKVDADHFKVSVKVDISDQFFAWVCGFGKRMVIETPEIAEQYKTHLEKILEKY